ncbi:HD domain-containing protein [candidate division WS5 bacterium]|uniref:HD domain-containing protein n=1 Tax=candidate division WS5 bacterium TaxID=2093353 RepID=A0A419DAC6_9BACT|nr:MAG: HD domain-containing protein [candidate division WS5 bacterium]
MNKQEIIEKTANFVKERLESDSSGHDWWHTYRVWRLAKHISEHENANHLVVELTALLHDIADWKLHDGDMKVGPKQAQEWLEILEVNKDDIYKVCDIIEKIPFKGAESNVPTDSIEASIVQDADRLDGIGAIGIARCFMFGGVKNLPMHNPDKSPNPSLKKEEYENIMRDTNTQINHFYEKLLLLKDLMNTDTGKKIAENRHKIMEDYLKEFFKEWEGEDLKS